SSLGDMAGSAFESIGNALGFGEGGVIDSLGDSVSSIGSALGFGESGVMDRLGDSVSSLGGALGLGEGGVMDRLGESVSSLGSPLGLGEGGVLESPGDPASSIGKTSAFGEGGAINSLGDAAGSALGEHTLLASPSEIPGQALGADSVFGSDLEDGSPLERADSAKSQRQPAFVSSDSLAEEAASDSLEARERSLPPDSTAALQNFKGGPAGESQDREAQPEMQSLAGSAAVSSHGRDPGASDAGPVTESSTRLDAVQSVEETSLGGQGAGDHQRGAPEFAMPDYGPLGADLGPEPPRAALEPPVSDRNLDSGPRQELPAWLSEISERSLSVPAPADGLSVAGPNDPLMGLMEPGFAASGQPSPTPEEASRQQNRQQPFHRSPGGHQAYGPAGENPAQDPEESFKGARQQPEGRPQQATPGSLATEGEEAQGDQRKQWWTSQETSKRQTGGRELSPEQQSQRGPAPSSETNNDSSSEHRQRREGERRQEHESEDRTRRQAQRQESRPDEVERKPRQQAQLERRRVGGGSGKQSEKEDRKRTSSQRHRPEEPAEQEDVSTRALPYGDRRKNVCKSCGQRLDTAALDPVGHRTGLCRACRPVSVYAVLAGPERAQPRTPRQEKRAILKPATDELSPRQEPVLMQLLADNEALHPTVLRKVAGNGLTFDAADALTLYGALDGAHPLREKIEHVIYREIARELDVQIQARPELATSWTAFAAKTRRMARPSSLHRSREAADFMLEVLAVYMRDGLHGTRRLEGKIPAESIRVLDALLRRGKIADLLSGRGDAGLLALK
ncbi:MAG: hypothetical protein HY319_12620, partial [Armatimonadetes bacterium]|nr:hypothetical protein [Armatimonadota bacterium]